MKKQTRPSMRDIVAEVESRPPEPRHGRTAVRVGGFNGAGELFDRTGSLLTLVESEVEPAVAAGLMTGTDPVSLAWEGCGCGGWVECQTEWVDDGEVARLRADGAAPRFEGRNRTPSWIDVWRSEVGATVLVAHGDVVWGDALA